MINLKIYGIRCYAKDKTQFAGQNNKYDEYKINDTVIVRYKNNSIDLAKIVYIPKCEKKHHNCENQDDMPLIIQKATQEDIEKRKSLNIAAIEALPKCYEQIKKHKLNMFLLDAYYLLDKSKITFFFSANGRIDFRELVKDLAYIFKTRIELYQVGVRDESKRLGGLGICGKAACCSYFLYDFSAVTIKMAKNQNLNLTPSKISGICGRLLCCLSYENDFYSEELKKYPPQFCTFTSNTGNGKVINFNVITETVTYSINNSYTKEMNITEFMKTYGDKLDYSKTEGRADEDITNRELIELEGE